MAGELTPRECEVLQEATKNGTEAQIGATLRIARATVSGHLEAIRTKLRVSTTTAAIAVAWERDLIE
jgi:DNA-binding CsgD family transcriptional regulator